MKRFGFLAWMFGLGVVVGSIFVDGALGWWMFGLGVLVNLGGACIESAGLQRDRKRVAAQILMEVERERDEMRRMIADMRERGQL